MYNFDNKQKPKLHTLVINLLHFLSVRLQRQILEKCSQHGKDTHNVFIDFKAAYDSIDRHSLYAAMEEMNIPQKLIVLARPQWTKLNVELRCGTDYQNPLMLKMDFDRGMHWLVYCLIQH